MKPSQAIGYMILACTNLNMHPVTIQQILNAMDNQIIIKSLKQAENALKIHQNERYTQTYE